MAELTVAGWFVSPLTKKPAEKALSYAGDQYHWLIQGPADSQKRLASSLTRIQATARSVERHQTHDTPHQHRAWLQQLRDAVYEIHDLLDEFSYLALKAAVQPKLTREIINSAENQVSVGTLNFGGLQQVLKRMVKSKKFLLVLDNVWHDDKDIAHAEERWRNALAPLRFGDHFASRILVTTRMLSVPKMLGCTDPLFLNRLTDTDEWSILKKFALGDDETSKAPKDLENIGWQIATKLDGSPLAAKVVGGMLRAKLTREFWKEKTCTRAASPL